MFVVVVCVSGQRTAPSGYQTFLPTAHLSMGKKKRYPLKHIFEFRALTHPAAARGRRVARGHFRSAVTHRAARWVVNNKVVCDQMWAYVGVCGTVKCNLVWSACRVCSKAVIRSLKLPLLRRPEVVQAHCWTVMDSGLAAQFSSLSSVVFVQQSDLKSLNSTICVQQLHFNSLSSTVSAQQC